GHMEIAVTFNDPKAYNKPWTFKLSARLAAETEMMEAVCNERPDNGQEHWIGKTSDAQKSALNVAPEVLAKYAGVYKGIYGRNPTDVRVIFARCGRAFTGRISARTRQGRRRTTLPDIGTSAAPNDPRFVSDLQRRSCRRRQQ